MNNNEKPDDLVRNVKPVFFNAWYEEKQECGHPNRWFVSWDDEGGGYCLGCSCNELRDQLTLTKQWSAVWKRAAKKWWSFKDEWHDYDRISRLLKRYEKRHPR